MSTIFSIDQRIPVPASVAVCPDCNGPMLVDLYEVAPFVEEANLWAPRGLLRPGMHDGTHLGNRPS